MTTLHQNKNGDYVFHLSFQGKDGNPIVPPQALDIRLSTDGGNTYFTAQFRADGNSSGCKMASDGIDVFVALSRNPIGTGRLMLETVSHIQDDNFPDGERRVSSKVSTPVVLWDGPSDGDINIHGTIIL